MNLNKKKIQCVFVATSLVLSTNTLAQRQLEEVVVTAQKRAESLQDVPISIQAFSGAALENAGITSTDDLGMVAPGLNVQRSGPANQIFMRGLGNQDATGGQEGSVGVYVDGVWYGSVTGSILSFENLERLEVLKGPQGTLFGRNTTGGVINIVTRDPSHETSGSAAVSYGNYDRKQASFYGTTGITDKLAADISFLWSDQGKGYGKNLHTGNDVNLLEDQVFVRTKWKYTGEATDVTFSASYEDFDNDLGNARGVPPGYVDLAGNRAPSDLRDVRNNVDPYAKFENIAVSLRVDHSTNHFDFVSITGYKDDELKSFADNDYSVFDLMDARVDYYSEAFTQEFQFLSNDPYSPVNWIAGVFYLDSEAGSDISVSGPGVWYDPVTSDPSGINELRFWGDIETKSYAVFGEIGYDFAERHSIKIGLRYTRDERKVSGADQYYMQGGFPFEKFAGIATDPIPTPKMKKSYSEPTWRIVYDMRVNDGLMFYGSYNRGFRSGNFNAVSPANPAFNPEFIDAYEIGFKSTLLGNTMQLSGSVFFYDVEDLQFQTLEGLTAQTINAAAAEILGAEIDFSWLVTNSLTINAGATVIDSEYKDFTNALVYPNNPAGGTLPGIIEDVSGNQLTRTPKWEASLGVVYSLFTKHGEYLTDLRISYNDGFPWEADGRLEQDSYTLVNLSFGWTSPSETWGVKLQGKNLLDEDYAVMAASSAPGDLYASAPPRTYMLTGNYKF